MLKMQFIQTMALINVIRLIRIGLLLFFKIMFLCKNMPCASTTQLSKPSWSTLNIWRHLVDLRWAFSLLWAGLARGSGAGGLQGCSSALHSHPLSASQSQRQGQTPGCAQADSSCPKLLPGQCCMGWEQLNTTDICLLGLTWLLLQLHFPRQRELPLWVPQRQGLGLSREQKGDHLHPAAPWLAPWLLTWHFEMILYIP